MTITCAICTDSLTSSCDIFHTPCGHIFHYACLTQWLNCSQTCPECRGTTTLNQVKRLYFNFANNNTTKEDARTMKDRLDTLLFKITLKDKYNEHLSKKCGALEGKTKILENKLEQVNMKTKKRIHKLQSEVAMALVDGFRKEQAQLTRPMETCRKFTDALNDLYAISVYLTQSILSTCQPPLPAS